MTIKDVVKILALVATLLTAAAGFLEAIKPSWALIATAVASAIFAFIEKVGRVPQPEPSVVPED